MRVQRRDGGVQALEYFCRGFEVGFHRYFDATGDLVAVADYTHSDYEWEKPVPSRIYREFYQGSSRLSSLAPGMERNHRFREVFRVSGDRTERASFSFASPFYSDWETLDPTSTIKDWTAPGLQGTVMLSKQPWQIRNVDFQYQSFAEVYQRKRLGAPAARAPREFNTTLLECPWIDEAMEPGLNDPRFKFEPPVILTETERAASPEQRLEACLRAPNVPCLLDAAGIAARRAQPLHGEPLRNFADDALAAAQPALARAAMEAALADARGDSFPSTSFARPSAIKAQAEAAMGLQDEAQKSAEAAFANAMGPNTHAAKRDVGMLEAIGPRLARVGALDQARAAFREVPLQYADDAPFTLEEIALTQARQGDIDGARETLIQLTHIGSQTGTPEPQVLLEIAAAQAERGDASAAAATLEKLARPDPYNSSQARAFNEKTAAIKARFAPSDALNAEIEQAIAGSELAPRLAVVSAYCESGHTALGVSTLDRARRAVRRAAAGWGADLGAAEAKCGRMDRARADFAEARKAIGRLSPYQGGDMVAVVDPVQSALSHLRLRMVEAGLIEGLPDAEELRPEEFAIALAARRAELGDGANALSALDAIRIEGGPGEDDLRQRLVLTRARVLRLLARDAEAESEFARARRIALAQDGGPAGPSMRGDLLVQLAEARLRDKQPARAKDALDEAQAVQLADLVRLGRRWMNGSGLASVARARAAAGDDAAAMDLIRAGSQQVKFRAIAMRAADRVNGEIAVAQARTGAATESVASLRKVEGAPWRVWYLAQVIAIAQARKDQALQTAVASLWAGALNESHRTIESARDVEERRRVYHAYLATLRRSNPPGTDAQRSAALESLRRNLDLFSNAGQRARAACELAFTYQHLGQNGLAAILFTEVQNLKIAPGTRREAGGAPLPAGACVYWMSSTPLSAQARTEVDRIVEARRSWAQSSNGMTRPEQALQELALIVSESEAGEIDWLTGARFTR